MEVEESENKPFDVEIAQDGEETQPEPDEHMVTDTATGRVWIVKVSEHAVQFLCVFQLHHRSRNS